MHLKQEQVEKGKVKTFTPCKEMIMRMGNRTFTGWRAIQPFLLLVAFLFYPLAWADNGGVYVSGQKFSFEQAADQALKEQGEDASRPFWVIVSGAEAKRVTKAAAEKEIADLIRKVRERGGLVYVCDAALDRYAISEDELMEGVQRVSGFGTPAPGFPAARYKNGLPASDAQSRLILRACAEEE